MHPIVIGARVSLLLALAVFTQTAVVEHQLMRAPPRLPQLEHKSACKDCQELKSRAEFLSCDKLRWTRHSTIVANRRLLQSPESRVQSPGERVSIDIATAPCSKDG